MIITHYLIDNRILFFMHHQQDIFNSYRKREQDSLKAQPHTHIVGPSRHISGKVTNRLLRYDAYPGKTAHHLCIAAADRQRLGSYPKVLGQASLQLRPSHPWRDRSG